MSAFPMFYTLNTSTFPGLSTPFPAEQVTLPLSEVPLSHQKSADLPAQDAMSQDELLAMVTSLLSTSVPGAHSSPVDHPISFEESPSQFTAAIRTKLHPRVAHACDHCRRRKTKCSGDQPVCDSCKKKGRACQWTPIKTTKERRSRKPYDVVEYRPRPSAPAPTAPYIAAPRPMYPSVMLPNPMTLWSTQDLMSASQATTMANIPMVKPVVQAHTGWSAPVQYDWQDLNVDIQWIESPPSSCPSLASSVSSCESSPPRTPVNVEEALVSASPLFVEEALPNFDDTDAFFRELFGSLPSEWSPLLDTGSWSL
ncbi:uncharacterized protein EDB91DRAFT_1337039 [Suillus paluster]|uniref:uncharacterized protein n=1 Tax=Suillus paluster TaxID=48578 RepID=UPI001B874167|nr:uncharacterized protein EDB91DRAFT_1337039 [Suillus paluster]KAG1738363.1 hypothetical protein EDB91DRAFT_1337039 [Suillus paluster]